MNHSRIIEDSTGRAHEVATDEPAFIALLKDIQDWQENKDGFYNFLETQRLAGFFTGSNRRGGIAELPLDLVERDTASTRPPRRIFLTAAAHPPPNGPLKAWRLGRFHDCC